ncbi:hypothetical protein F5Y16DRAFT_405782 [Xylariaceae sp. FL0255]|nr:hypothetical protein F5Y16DRAFT_405782 [Xylariaceae sp. FL0255]
MDVDEDKIRVTKGKRGDRGRGEGSQGGQGESQGGKEGGKDAASEDDDDDNEDAKTERPNRCPSIPDYIPDDIAYQASCTQFALFKLLFLAEKYGWETLFNATIDTFRHNESLLQRRFVPLNIINLALESSKEPSLLKIYMADWMTSVGFANKTMSEYTTNGRAAIFEEVPGLVDLMCRRLDLVAYNPAREMQAHVGTQYHCHEGVVCARCECPKPW